MEDGNCPYCGESVEICHDDGYGYEEDRFHEQQCGSCDKFFTYMTSVSFDYDLKAAECLNDGNHVLKASCTYPIRYTKMKCENCDYEQDPTEEELETVFVEYEKRHGRRPER